MAKMIAEDRKLVARMKEIRELIKEFGLTLYGYDPGISAYWDSRPELRASAFSGPIRIGRHEWEWLEPLLIELRTLRKISKPDPDRLLAWLFNPKRKPANVAFTDGPDRQVAYWMEMAMLLVDVKRKLKKGKK